MAQVLSELDELSLVKLAQTTSDERSDAAIIELYSHYKKYIRKHVEHFFMPGADKSDLTSYGMLGLVKAIRSFDSEKNTSFSSYAHVCIRHGILTAIRDATSGTQKALNESTSIESLCDDPLHGSVDDAFLSMSAEDRIIREESSESFFWNIYSVLTEFESSVLQLFLDKYSYKEIAASLSCDTKAVDNAMYRIRKKIAGLK